MLGMIGALALIWIGFHLYTLIVSGEGLFLTPRNLWNLWVQTSSIAVMATGMVLIIVMRNIDLSVGSILGFARRSSASRRSDLLPVYLGLDNPAIWIIALVVGACRSARRSAPSMATHRLSRHPGLHRHARRPVVLARRRVVGDGGPDDRAARHALSADGRRPAWLDRRDGELDRSALLGCAGSVGLCAGRRRRARFHFPLRPMWAEYVIGGVGCFAILGATAIVNAYPWPDGSRGLCRSATTSPCPKAGCSSPHGIAIPVLIALVVGVVMTFLARRTRFGRYVYAIGGNPEAAELAGINTSWITMMVFALMGVLAGSPPAFRSARLNAATNVLGQFDELYVIAAAVIGGTSLAGGVGTIYGALIGALVIQSLQSGMVLLGFDSPFQQMVVGVVLVGAVWHRHLLPPPNRQGLSHGQSERDDAAGRDEGHLDRFRRRQAVDHASIDLFPGEVVGLLGHNGAGKSTLIKILSGAYKRDSGQIFINGQEARSTTRATPSTTASRRSIRRSRSPTTSTPRPTSISAANCSPAGARSTTSRWRRRRAR